MTLQVPVAGFPWRLFLLPAFLVSRAVLFCETGRAADAPLPFAVGVGTHFANGAGVLPVNLSLIQQAHVGAIRDGLLWQFVETSNGQMEMPARYEDYVRRALQARVSPLLILGGWSKFHENGSDRPQSAEALEALARYCEFVVRHFKGRVRTYEIWNEWDAPSRQTGVPGSAEGYVEVLKAVYPRMKAADPSIVVLGGAMTSKAPGSGWLERFLRAGALQYLDAVSIHSYTNLGAPYARRGAEAWASWMQRVDERIREHGGDRQFPVYVTEMGWTTELHRGVRPDLSAAYLARMYLLARTMPFLQGIWWYDFQDDGWNFADREHNFGLVRADLTPKPSYFAMAGIAAFVRTAQYVGRIDAGDPDIWILKFRLPEGKDAWAMWSAHEYDDWQVTLRSGQSRPEPLSLCRVGNTSFQRPWGRREWRRDAPIVPDELSLLVREMPWLVIGDLSTVSVANVERRKFPESQRPVPGPTPDGGDARSIRSPSIP